MYKNTEDNSRVYGNEYSTLDLLNRFITIAYNHVSSEMNDTEVVIANMSWRKKDWKFIRKSEMGNKNMIGITQNNLIRIIHKSIS